MGLELVGDRLGAARAALLRDDADEVAHDRVGAAHDLFEHVCLRVGAELRVGEERLELGRRLERVGDLRDLVARDVDAALCLRGLVERSRVHAVVRRP